MLGDIAYVVNQLMAKHDTIEELCVSCSTFSQKGIDQVMKIGQKIQSLGFDKVGLTESILLGFNRFIIVMKNLKVLSMEYNHIGDKGIKVLLDNFKNATSLVYLNISENVLTDGLNQTLKMFLSTNTSIECFECERNLYSWLNQLLRPHR